MNKKPQLAWKLYLKMETSGESINLLQLIANDCYKVSLSLIIKKKIKSGPDDFLCPFQQGLFQDSVI